MLFIAADIGGTNTRLICVEQGEKDQQTIAEKTYSSESYTDFYSILKLFLSEHDITDVTAACFAVAGPVKSGFASVTNLPWQISEKKLAEILNTAKVKLINDFVAAGYGVSGLKEGDTLILQQAKQTDNTSFIKDAAIIGAGTGLGAAHLVWQRDHYQVLSSETGHVGFAPENTQQTELLSWLHQQHKHVSLEMLLSGHGLHTIYNFLHEVSGVKESTAIHHVLRATDPAQIITQHALLENDVLCQKTLECFIDIYGAAASNVTLSYYPVGELYIAGGIANKIKKKMSGQRFLTAFLNKGVMTENMQNITIKLITQEKLGLYGALSQSVVL